MNVQTKTVKLSEIKPNPENPRSISKKALGLLVKSLKDFPEMLDIREIVVDETMTVLGGNMRLQALLKSGAVECVAKIVTGLTDGQKREFIIKDNAGFGRWDFGLLLESWADLPLEKWGVDLPEFFSQGAQKGARNEESDERYQTESMENYVERYEIIIQCDTEQQQVKLLKKFSNEGLKCKAIVV